jgi:nucleoside-diphosphate-sugar epimerase
VLKSIPVTCVRRRLIFCREMPQRHSEHLVGGLRSVLTSARQEKTLLEAGTPRREFLHVDDLANAACFVMENFDGSDLLNVGVGEDLSIAELAMIVGTWTH